MKIKKILNWKRIPKCEMKPWSYINIRVLYILIPCKLYFQNLFYCPFQQKKSVQLSTSFISKSTFRANTICNCRKKTAVETSNQLLIIIIVYFCHFTDVFQLRKITNILLYFCRFVVSHVTTLNKKKLCFNSYLHNQCVK